MNFLYFSKDWLNEFDLNPCAFNHIPGILPNLWCLCNTHLNHVVIFMMINMYPLVFSTIFPSTSYLHRKELWNNLTTKIPKTPWCFVGDYNAIISVDEYKGRHSPTRAPMSDFFNWSNTNHIHILTIADKYTWSNGK